MSDCVTSGFSTIRMHVILETSSVFPSFVKDDSSYFQCSPILFKCQCDADYLGRTNQRFETRIIQRVPASIRLGNLSHSSRITQPTNDSTIVQYLLDNPEINDITFENLMSKNGQN